MKDPITVNVLSIRPDPDKRMSTGIGWMLDGRYVRRRVEFKVPGTTGLDEFTSRSSYQQARDLAAELLAKGAAEVEVPIEYVTHVGEPGSGY